MLSHTYISLTYKNVYQFARTAQKAPDNSKVHKTSKICVSLVATKFASCLPSDVQNLEMVHGFLKNLQTLPVSSALIQIQSQTWLGFLFVVLNTGVLISPQPDQEGNKLQRPNSNFCKPLKKKKKIRRLSVQPGLRGSIDLRVGRKMATFELFFYSGRAMDLSATLYIT